MSSKRKRHGRISSTTTNGITLVIVLACVVVSVVILLFLYQHFCRKKRGRGRGRGRGGDGSYTSVGMTDSQEDGDDGDDGGWMSYDSTAFDWDPEEARVKRRLIVTEKAKSRLNDQVENLDRQLTARRRQLDRVSDQSVQLTSRLNTSRRDGPSSMGSNIDHIPSDSPAMTEVDEKGREMFGDKWTSRGDNGELPLRSILSLAPEDLEEIKRGLETARDEARNERRSVRRSGSKLVERGTGHVDSTLTSDDGGYEGHSRLLARTSVLAERLRAASRSK